MAKFAAFSLAGDAIEAAVRARLDRGKDRLGDRENRVGASKVGYCARATVLDHLCPAETEIKTAGKFLSGRALENEVIQIVRIALEGRVRNTGKVQEELEHPEFPLICHPDGTLLGPFEHEGVIYEGDGALEVKSCSANAFKSYATKGLPKWYVDQNITQQGLKGLGWGLVVVVNAESLSEVLWWVIPFDAPRYENLLARSAFIQKCRQDSTIPAGETDRGWCAYCRHRKTCAEYVGVKQRADEEAVSMSESVRLELEALGEELALVQAQMEPLKTREEQIKAEARALFESTGLKKTALATVSCELRGGGEGNEFDKKAFEKDQPDLFAKYLKPKLTKPSFYFTPAPLA